MTGVPRDVVERLYAASPDGFVAARDEAVSAARAAGDVAGAREIAKLRKPTVAAWLVNLLALRRPDLVADLEELSTALRSAQRELRGPQLRELSAQRRGVVNGLVAQARELAREADPDAPAGKLPMNEVEAALNAALSDEEVARQVRSGQLVRTPSYAGFGEVPRPQLRLVTGRADEATTTAPDRAETAAARRAGTDAEAKAEADKRAAKEEAAALAAQRRALSKELASARTQQKRAEGELERAVAAERAAGDKLADLEAALADLERRRAAADEEASRRKMARKAAERGSVAARRRTGEVQAAIEALDAEEGAARGRKAQSTR